VISRYIAILSLKIRVTLRYPDAGAPADIRLYNVAGSPPPPPAPSTAGSLSDESLPIPAGWQTAVLEGGDEEGFHGNGTWVHARDMP
jgi:hypothetical protein